MDTFVFVDPIAVPVNLTGSPIAELKSDLEVFRLCICRAAKSRITLNGGKYECNRYCRIIFGNGFTSFSPNRACFEAILCVFAVGGRRLTVPGFTTTLRTAQTVELYTTLVPSESQDQSCKSSGLLRTVFCFCSRWHAAASETKIEIKK